MSQNKQTIKELFWEFFRFLLVGGLSTIVDYAIFYLFRQCILPSSLIAESGAWDSVSLIIATALGFLCGLVTSWTFSLKFVYRNLKDREQAGSKKSFILFAIIGFFGLIITEIGMHVIVGACPEIFLFQTTELLGLPWKEWLAKMIMTCIVLVWNYLGRKIFIFKS